MFYLAPVFGLVLEEGHDAHVPDGRKVVEERDGEVHDQLVAAVRAQVEEGVVQLHLEYLEMSNCLAAHTCPTLRFTSLHIFTNWCCLKMKILTRKKFAASFSCVTKILKLTKCRQYTSWSLTSPQTVMCTCTTSQLQSCDDVEKFLLSSLTTTQTVLAHSKSSHSQWHCKRIQVTHNRVLQLTYNLCESFTSSLWVWTKT